MNILEQYIEEVHSVKPYTEDWTKEFPNKTFVEADITTNCYGQKKRAIHVFEEDEWETALEKGYYMG
ncbi:hypothetical protein BSP36_147 [Bacillus phage BSP36]|uniref:Uncharacterized protein n=1 Tax=Bacillus phage BSP38 TaxID=2283013 RepID=A0A345MK11_BPBSP|nr:hypothetical protein HWB82_gp167 [Bacillus phage BSP38]AXH71193.1 hypothetical protein BSP38_151 [Bacillus phage BSP38]AYJ75234.1 hypothetical protein BSP36_147 [Bacillus phage BSP36]